MEPRVIGAETVTRIGLMDLNSGSLVNILYSHGVFTSNHEATNQAVVAEENLSNIHENTTYYWDSRFHLVPRTFDFPKVPLRILFQYWIFGDRRHGFPPFKVLQANDLTDDPRKSLPQACM